MQDNQLFKKFVVEMNCILRENEVEDSRDQRKLLEDLFHYETRFKEILISIPEGRSMYKDFMDFILYEKKNILSCRSYFRERQDMFSTKISKAFQQKKFYLLSEFNINHNFIKWVIDRYEGPKKRYLIYNYCKVVEIRKILCENNLPLAINRAKVFWSKFSESPVEYMDMVQASAEGLLNAIDKYVLPYKEVFKSVMVGRMMLNMSTDHNDTLLKMSTNDKRILYRANTARKKSIEIEETEVLDYVKEKFDNVTPKKLHEITSAAINNVSLDQKTSDQKMTIGESTPSFHPTPEDIVIDIDIHQTFVNAVEELPTTQMKVIKLRLGEIFK